MPPGTPSALRPGERTRDAPIVSDGRGNYLETSEDEATNHRKVMKASCRLHQEEPVWQKLAPPFALSTSVAAPRAASHRIERANHSRTNTLVAGHLGNWQEWDSIPERKLRGDFRSRRA